MCEFTTPCRSLVMDANVRQIQRARIFEAAVTIGRQLCAAAIWTKDERYANWMGRRDITEDSLLAKYSVRSAALGPDLYAGSSGIALFLAELYGQTGELQFAVTAAAALRRSVLYLQTHDLPLHPYSFFAGHAGILAAALRLRATTPDEDVTAECDWLAAQIAEGHAPPTSPDIIAGGAGAVLALIKVADLSGSVTALETARACANDLCARGQWMGEACAWMPHSMSDRKSPPMAGVAHGAAGVALAMMALYQRVPDPAYLAAARGALAFTDLLYDETEGNWVDTRMEHARIGGRLTGTFQTGWCHGAAGIMLVRLRAIDMEPTEAKKHRALASRAAESVASGLNAKISVPQADASLCHGLFGSNDALATYARAVGDEDAEAKSLDMAIALLPRYSELEQWPSGINAGGPNPSLMVGTAGIGYHLLRLAGRQSVAPILTLLS